MKNTVACKAVAMQPTRDGRIYQGSVNTFPRNNGTMPVAWRQILTNVTAGFYVVRAEKL
jgi:hypothetical protein